MLKFALLGCGRIAKRHSRIASFNKIKNATLVSVCDINEQSSKNCYAI